MADLTTTYLGLKLKNPVIAGASGLMASVEGIQKAERAGAGAVVLKSLFEEQIRIETAETAAGLQDWAHPEAQAYVQTEVWMRYGPRDYCRLVEDAKRTTSIPLIASVNCVGSKWWTDYAKDLEYAGADAIELNILVPGTDPRQPAAEVERICCDVTHQVASQVTVPVAVKIGSAFSSLAHLAQELVRAGAKGLVLFNRFHQPDIDIEKRELVSASPFSEPRDMHLALRWIGLLSHTVQADFAASTGLHQAEQVIKQLLAGATVGQLVTVLYRNGIEHLTTVIQDLEAWMERQGLATVDEFRGQLNYQRAETPALYERRQYIKHLVGIH